MTGRQSRASAATGRRITRAGGLLVVMAFLVTCAPAAEAARLEKGYAMCRDRASLHQLVEASIDHDDATVHRLMQRSCAVVAQARKVRILTRTSTVTRIAIARRGTWWTVVEAVR